MPRTSRLHLFGIPFYIDPSWFLVAAYLTWSLATGYFPFEYPVFREPVYWFMGASSAVLLFTCVVLHELGHALTARLHGIRVVSITLFVFGGVAHIAQESERPSVELKIALAGPVISGLIAAGCFGLTHVLPMRTPQELIVFAIVRYLAMINTAILVFNLFPGFPLDGGRVLRAVLWAGTRNFALATRITCGIGSGFGVALIVLGVFGMLRGGISHGIWYVLLGLFLYNAARSSARRVSR